MTSLDGDTPAGMEARVRTRLRDAMVTGIAITIPVIVTVIVLGFVVNFISNTLNPVVDVVDTAFGSSPPDPAVKVLAAVTLVLTILAVGLVAQRSPSERSVENSFDQMMARIPGIGSVYTSFNEMSELLLDSDTESFQEVKLVEYPDEGSYTVAFLTADTPARIEHATGHDEMQTLFLPMAPNPVMGGFVIHVSEDRIIDVDMTVQEGIRSIVTSGVAVEDATEDTLSASELADLAHDPDEEQLGVPSQPGPTESGDGQSRRSEYDEAVDPEHAGDPRDIAQRERSDPDDEVVADGTPQTPSDLETLSSDDGRPQSAGPGEDGAVGTDSDELTDADSDETGQG
jgi:uncharacterized membrane protein